MAEASAPGEPATRAPYGSQSDRREKAKAATRLRLLTATCETMLRSVRGDIKVEDIVSAASVSRATFYLHFPSIDDALAAVRSDMTALLDGEYAKLAAMGRVDDHALETWLEDMLGMCREHRAMILALMRTRNLSAADFDARLYYRGVIERLGASHAAFRAAHERSDVRAEALLLLLQIEGLIRYFVVADGGDEEPAMVRQIAGDLRQFIDTRASRP